MTHQYRYFFGKQSGKTRGTIVKNMSNIYQQEGFKAFWNGNGANTLKIMPESAMRFLGYEVFKNWVCRVTENKENIKSNTWVHAASYWLVAKYTSTANFFIFRFDINVRLCSFFFSIFLYLSVCYHTSSCQVPKKREPERRWAAFSVRVCTHYRLERGCLTAPALPPLSRHHTLTEANLDTARAPYLYVLYELKCVSRVTCGHCHACFPFPCVMFIAMAW